MWGRRDSYLIQWRVVLGDSTGAGDEGPEILSLIKFFLQCKIVRGRFTRITRLNPLKPDQKISNLRPPRNSVRHPPHRLYTSLAISLHGMK